jgi:hypothetical protein
LLDAYGVCPTRAAAFLILRELDDPASSPIIFPGLAGIETEAERLIGLLELKEVAGLVGGVRNTGRLG